MLQLGVKSDVWSLGCILYNMVYKTTPFQRINNQIGKLQAIINPNFAIEFPDIEDKALLDTLKVSICYTYQHVILVSINGLS